MIGAAYCFWLSTHARICGEMQAAIAGGSARALMRPSRSMHSTAARSGCAGSSSLAIRSAGCRTPLSSAHLCQCNAACTPRSWPITRRRSSINSGRASSGSSPVSPDTTVHARATTPRSWRRLAAHVATASRSSVPPERAVPRSRPRKTFMAADRTARCGACVCAHAQSMTSAVHVRRPRADLGWRKVSAKHLASSVTAWSAYSASATALCSMLSVASASAVRTCGKKSSRNWSTRLRWLASTE
mmetsp:Transcript_7111/g.21465  ORF Transcript_7111/g.21465 Transcript_7111/m.21465 type:complete len:244 (-) Transcript_7111:720-1451(-)